MGRIIGQGAWGCVKHATHKKTGKSYAVKIMSKYELIRQKQADHAKNELDILRKIKHPFLVKFEQFEQDRSCVYMMQEFINGGEFLMLLKQKTALDIPSAKFFAAQMVLALEHMHKNNIIYRDLKPENMLIDRAGYLKIIDFGLSKKITKRTYTICGTPHYIAPEILLGKGYGIEADWFSLGVVLYEVLLGRMPFCGSTPNDVFKAILDKSPKFPKEFDPEAKHLIKGLLRKDPTKRYGAKKVMAHPFFERVSFEDILSKSLEPPFFPTVTSDHDTNNFSKVKVPILNKENCPKLRAEEDIFRDW
jgi:serine/threonine protein kinase